MVRKCSHCGHNGHNSRTCIGTRGMAAGGGGVKLFGVQLHMALPLEKSFSMECFSCPHPFAPSSSSSSSTSSLGSVDEATEKTTFGYLSDALGDRKQQERKKGESLFLFELELLVIFNCDKAVFVMDRSFMD